MGRSSIGEAFGVRRFVAVKCGEPNDSKANGRSQRFLAPPHAVRLACQGGHADKTAGALMGDLKQGSENSRFGRTPSARSAELQLCALNRLFHAELELRAPAAALSPRGMFLTRSRQ